MGEKKLPARTAFAAVLVILCIPAVIAADILLFDDRSYYVVSLIIIVLSMLPFALVFEGRKPQARELVVIAVMVAIAVAGRAAFFMVPQFKPVAALVIIAGAALGAESGFICGALAAFVSNFIFGQGPWTPWQMFAFGVIGFLSGLIFSRMAATIGAPTRDTAPSSSAGRPAHAPTQPKAKGAAQGDGSFVSSSAGRPAHAPTQPKAKWYDTARLGWNVRARKRVEWLRIFVLCAFGGAIVFVAYGVLLDTAATVMFTQGDFSATALIATYISGMPFNAIHAGATVIFLALVARPMIEKLERVKKKYGLYHGGRP